MRQFIKIIYAIMADKLIQVKSHLYLIITRERTRFWMLI